MNEFIQHFLLALLSAVLVPLFDFILIACPFIIAFHIAKTKSNENALMMIGSIGAFSLAPLMLHQSITLPLCTFIFMLGFLHFQPAFDPHMTMLFGGFIIVFMRNFLGAIPAILTGKFPLKNLVKIPAFLLFLGMTIFISIINAISTLLVGKLIL